MAVFFWAKIPFVRITLFFIIGVVLALKLPGFYYQVAGFLVFILITLSFLQLYKRKFLIRYNPLFGVCISLLFVGLGYLNIWLHTASQDNGHIAKFKSIEKYYAEVVTEPEQRPLTISALLRIKAVKANDHWQQASGYVQAYFYIKDSLGVEIGDEILVDGPPTEISGPKNPFEFNYKAYLANKAIYHRHWIAQADWLAIKPNKEFRLEYSAAKVRSALENRLNHYIPIHEARGIIKALVIGDKDELDPETKSIYAEAGVVHVLAVSGLHVGIIYLILLWLFRPVVRVISVQWLPTVIIIVILWGYAFLTGLSPSVLRAVTMFSILEIGRQINRQASVFNSLALSAFVLIWLNPYLITQVGFQLSYIAVTGILLLYKPIVSLYSPTNLFVKYCWQLMAVSLAAQIATAPLVAYYFHQFPTYFLISNLMVIPVVTLLVWGGITLLFMSFITDFLSLLLGKVLTFLVLGLNLGLEGLTNLPFSTIDRISIDKVELVLIYLVIGLLIAIFKLGISKPLKITLAIMIAMFLVKSIASNYQDINKQEIIFYSLGKTQWAIDFIQNGEYQSLMDSSIKSNTIDYSIQPYRISNNLRKSAAKVHTYDLNGLGKVVVWQNIKILISERCEFDSRHESIFDFILLPYNHSCADNNLLIKLVDNRIHKSYELSKYAYVAKLNE